MPAEEKDEPLYKRPRSEKDLVSGFEAEKIDDESSASKPASETPTAPGQEEGAEEARGVVVSLLAPDIAGDYAVFVALPQRLIIVEDQEGDSDLGALADAVEKRLQAPYRARALRGDGQRFVVVAGEIETVELPGLDGEELVVFALPDGQRTAVLDGARYELASPEVESILEDSAPCLLRLENVDESVWEISLELL